jgi:hypothetical protein
MELTRSQLISELTEKQKDLEEFTKARDICWNRLVEVRDSSTSKLMPIHEWAGAHAVMNTFDVVLHNMEKLVEELKAVLNQTVEEKPRLRLVKEEDEQGSPDNS